MRWRKLGRLFDPATAGLGAGCGEFAQSPQALVLPDRVRVFFCSRSRDPEGGKFRSHVFRADFSRDLARVLEVGREPVIALGARGCFDEHGIFPLNVLAHGDRVYGYSCGWSRRVSVSVETAIGFATSQDGGLRFEKHGTGPILGPSLHEPFLVGDAFVRVFDGRFHMWYIFGTAWRSYSPGAVAERTYKIAHAVSDDGVAWEKDEAIAIVADRLGPDESQALPTVARIGDRYHMYFCYRYSSDFRTHAGRGYRLGHAWSRDLVTWTRDDDEGAVHGTPGDWDADMQCYPHLVDTGEAVFLLYNGNAFGRHGFGACVLE